VWIEALTERAASRAQMPGLRPHAWAKGPGLDNSVAVVPALGRLARVSMWRPTGVMASSGRQGAGREAKRGGAQV
jgi:hypothetical protein